MLSGNKGMVSSRSIVVLLACLVVLGLSSSICSADLSPADDAALTAAWEVLQYGFDQTAANTAYYIYINGAYTQTDWQTWFNKYFNTQAHYFTAQLWWNAIWGFMGNYDVPTRTKLQTALVTPLWTRFTGIVAAHPSDLGMALATDLNLCQTAFYVNVFFTDTEEDTVISAATRTTIFNNYDAHIQAYPQYWSDATTIDPNTQPFIGTLRCQVWSSFVQAKTLDTSTKNTIKAALDLTGSKATLWDNRSMLVFDNNGLSAAAMQFIADLRGTMPAGLMDQRFLSFREYLTVDWYNTLIRKGWNADGGENYNLWTDKPYGVISFQTNGPSGWCSVWSGAVPICTWSHLAATYDGTTNPNSVKTYVNGILSTTGQADGTPLTASPTGLTLGAWNAANEWLTGKLDDSKVYARCLSGTEINNEYNGIPVSTSQLKGWWKMDETGGTTVADSSGYGNNGTRNGATIVPGWLNNALSFDGINDYVSVPDSASLKIGGAFTVETWVWFLNDDYIGFWAGAAGYSNSFGGDVGVSASNEFPTDIAPKYMDAWASPLVHEMNHVVNGQYIANDPTLNARQNQLIDQAGITQMQYLRSMIAEGYFYNNRGEFWASTAQQWWSSSFHTLELGLQRFNAGYHEPINQVLFAADVLSMGTNTTTFYDVNTSGVIATTNVNMTRDGNGHINSLTYGGTTYTFTLDSSGNVLSWTTGGGGAAPTFVGAGTVISGTSAQTVPLPSSIATNDILLLFVETQNEAITVSNQNGGTWTQVTNSPQGTGSGTAGTRLTVFWSRYNGTQGAPTISDSGNHQTGRIIAIRGATTSGNPWDVTAGAVEATADTTGSIPGVTTTVANTLVVTAIATALPDSNGTTNFSAWTNANLSSLTERTDNTSTSGNGGGIGVATGVKATAGATGNTAVTCGANAYKGMMTIAIKP